MSPWACRVEERVGLDLVRLDLVRLADERLADERLPDERLADERLADERGDLRFGPFLRLLMDDEGFRTFFTKTLAECRFSAYFLELPPLTEARMNDPVEFVLVDAPPLSRLRADPDAFANEFAKAASSVATFANLGGDATLIVPCPVAPPSTYPHLASFVRTAPTAQRHALLSALGRAVSERVGERPLWVSTAGLGVSWLHVRLDSRPKYYRHAPYKTA